MVILMQTYKLEHHGPMDFSAVIANLTPRWYSILEF